MTSIRQTGIGDVCSAGLKVLVHMNGERKYLSDCHDDDLNEEIWNEIRGLRQGLICTIGLLVNLLEEQGTLEDGVYREAICQALRVIETENSASPEARVLGEFVATLGFSSNAAKRIQ